MQQNKDKDKKEEYHKKMQILSDHKNISPQSGSMARTIRLEVPIYNCKINYGLVKEKIYICFKFAQ